MIGSMTLFPRVIHAVTPHPPAGPLSPHPPSRSLSRMPPLPSLESLARVNTALAQEQRRANNPRRTLQVLLDSLRSESLSVRYTVRAFVSDKQ